MPLTINRIQKAIAIHGLRGVVRMCVAMALRSVSRSASRRQSTRSASEHPDLEFDRKWGVDTGGALVLERSEVIGTNWLYGVNYGGCNPTTLEKVLSEIEIEHELFTFVDFGSGKGRGILTASLFPFR
jgi:hypothetical protein